MYALLYRFRRLIEEDGRLLAQRVAKGTVGRWGVNPNHVTLLGTLLNLVAAALIVNNMLLLGAIVFLVGSLLDAMDGAIAKVTGRATDFGAFFDSTLDRISEGLVLTGLGLWFAERDHTVALAACFVALASSYLVSYTRARAESLGVECKVGLASRAERVILLTIGLALGERFEGILDVVVIVLAATAAYTVGQRIMHVRTAIRRRDAIAE